MTNLSRLLKNIINEEIDLALKDINKGIFFEQQAPPPDPAAAPPAAPGADPAAPGAPPAGEEDKDDTGDAITKKIESLAKRSDEDIKKTLKAGLQDGSKEKETMEIMSKVINSIDKDTPENVKRMAIEFQKEFDIEVPADMEEDGENNKAAPAPAPAPAVPGQPPAPPAAPATPAPIKESRLQTNLREYLAYKKLYQRHNSKRS
jgi:hypothetical protein